MNLKWAHLLKSFVFSLLILNHIDGFSEVKIEVKHSEAASYLHFLATGFDEPFTSGALREVIKLRGIDEVFKNSELRANYQSLKSLLENGYNFPTPVASRPEGFWGADAIWVLAANSADLETFEKQLSLLLPYDGVSAYFRIKEKLYPYFRKWAWESRSSTRDSMEREIRRAVESSGLNELLEKARIFYRSDYPTALPFKVSLIPIPDDGIATKHTSATNLRDVQIVPYLKSKGAKDSLEVIFHEFCHALYEAQPSHVKTEIDTFYRKHSSRHALFVYRYINEILATAWGNGIYSEVLNGKLNSGHWYTVPYIDQIAKALVPVIKGQSDAKKNLDSAFFEQAIKIAETLFPDAPRELAPNFMAVHIFSTSGAEMMDSVRRELRSVFRIQSLKSTRPLKNSDWKEIFEDAYSTPILLTENSDLALQKLRLKLSSDQKKRIAGNKNFLLIEPRPNNYFIWLNTENLDSAKSLLEEVGTYKMLPEKSTLLLR